MNLTIEIVNKDDYPFIKELLERLKGVNIISDDVELIDGVPGHVFDAIDKYGESLDEDLISHEKFLDFIDDEICRLNSHK